MRVLVVNAGSSSLKLAVLDDDDAVVVSGDDLQAVLSEAGGIAAVGQRIVHGGDDWGLGVDSAGRGHAYGRDR